MFNRPKKSKHSQNVITKIEFSFTEIKIPKPYELTASGHFSTEFGVQMFECNLYVSQMPISNTVTVFGNIHLPTLIHGGSHVTATTPTKSVDINFDFPMHKGLRELPHAVVYGVLQYGILDEEAIIDYQTELLEKLWEVVDNTDA